MTRWVITTANQPPVFVDIENDRNLTAEFEAFRNRKQPWWERLLRVSPGPWRVTETVSFHPEIVLSIRPAPRSKRAARKVIGFKTPS